MTIPIRKRSNGTSIVGHKRGGPDEAAPLILLDYHESEEDVLVEQAALQQPAVPPTLQGQQDDPPQPLTAQEQQIIFGEGRSPLPFLVGQGNLQVASDTPSNLTEALKSKLATPLNKGTIANYATATRHLMRMYSSNNMKLKLPLSITDICLYLVYLETQNVGRQTASNYLDGLVFLHRSLGLDPPNINDKVVHYTLSNIKPSTARPRVPIMAGTLRAFKLGLHNDKKLDREETRAFWAAATICWHGFLRMGEVLSKRARTTEENSTLLWEDIRIFNDHIAILLKSSKTDRIGRGHIIKIYRTDTDICPWKAMVSYRAMLHQINPKAPVFRRTNQNNITKDAMNSMLHRHCAQAEESSYGRVSCHSLRQGAATTAKLIGWNDEMIAGAGRWTSEAYKNYIGLPLETKIPWLLRMSSPEE